MPRNRFSDRYKGEVVKLLLLIFCVFAAAASPQNDIVVPSALQKLPLPTGFYYGADYWRIETKHPVEASSPRIRGIACDHAAVRKRECPAAEERYVVLDSQMPAAELRHVLYHELLHVVIGTQQSPKKCKMHTYIQKSEPIINLLRDPRNKALREYLFRVQ